MKFLSKAEAVGIALGELSFNTESLLTVASHLRLTRGSYFASTLREVSSDKLVSDYGHIDLLVSKMHDKGEAIRKEAGKSLKNQQAINKSLRLTQETLFWHGIRKKKRMRERMRRSSQLC